MTGFGTAESDLGEGRVLRVDVRTVNHRHLSTSLRLPAAWESLESVAAARIRAALGRGRVSLAARVVVGTGGDGGTGRGAEDDGLRLDRERVARAVEMLRRTCADLGVDDRLDASALARLPGAWRTEPGAPEELPSADDFAACVDEALGQVSAMRGEEGRRLEDALRRSLASIAATVDRIERLAPGRLVRQRDRLRERVGALAEDVEVDEDRLAREVAYLATRWDVAEEVVRLRSHVELFGETLDSEEGRPAGKRLEFLAQEMGREANTIGAKANDADIAEAVVSIKEELERVREQAENVE